MKKSGKTGYDVTVAPCRTCMGLFGSWPDPFVDVNWFSCLRALIVVSTMAFFATITQTAELVNIWGDLNVMTEIFVSSQVTSSMAILKIIYTWYYRTELRHLLSQMSEDWKSSHNSEELNTMMFNAKFGRIVSGTCIFLANATFVAQAGLAFYQIYSFGKSLADKNITSDWPLYMRASFPYDAQVSPNYQLTIAGQMFSNIFAATTYTSIDGLFIILVLHLCGQLKVLRLRLVGIRVNPEDPKSRREFARTIAFVQQRHVRLTRFNQSIEEVFNKTFLVQVLCSSVVLCILGYQLVTMMKGNTITFLESLFWIYYILCFLFITFAYCYMGERLQEESLEIAEAAYNCNWIDLPCQQSRQLIMIMMRARKPLSITVGKFASFSLVLYCRILKSSGGYMSMLLAVQDSIDEN